MVALESTCAEGRVVEADGIVKQGQQSDCRIVITRGTAKERRPTNGRIPVPCVVEERSGAEGRVPQTAYVAPERRPTNSCVVAPGVDVQAQKGVLALCRVLSGIAAVRRWDDRVPCWQKAKGN